MGAEIFATVGFSVTVWIVNIVGFLVLLAMLTQWLWRPLRAMVEGRAERIAAQLREAQEKLAEAQRRREEAEQYYAARQQEAQQAREAILRQAEEEAERLKQQARAEAAAVRQQAHHYASRLQAEALERAKAELADLAGGMAARLLTAVLDAERHQALLEAALADLESLVRQEGKP
jgi:F-type H+-transporting ATPase subunit b